jgi:hypothetical protein
VTDWLYMPPWGIRLVAVAGIALVMLGLLRALRERRMAPLRRQTVALVLRGLVILGLLWIALNPTAMRPHEVEGKPSLAILVDTSASMGTADVSGETRLRAALKTLAAKGVISDLENAFTLDVRTFDKESRPATLASLSAAAEGGASNLGSALSSTVSDLAGRPAQAGILVVSDGRPTSEGAMDAARLALARSVPLWTWCLGGPVERRDLWIEAPGSEVLAFADTKVELSATLHAVGYENRSFKTELLKDGQVIESQDVVPGPAGDVPLKATIQAPAEGEHRYVWRAVVEKDEADKDNNERSVFVRVVGEKVRVLLAEGQPHWDTKFLVQCLKRNPRVELTAVYRLGAQRPLAVVSAGGGEQRREGEDLFPRTAKDFEKYDTVIMGRGCEVFFDEKTDGLLTDFVSRHGGGLIFSRGKAYSGRFPALSKLEPIVWGTGTVEGVRLVPATGGANPVFELASAGPVEALIGQLPPFDQAMQTVGVKPLATVMASGQPLSSPGGGDLPVAMAYHYYGQGRVVSINAGGLWRWAFREKIAEEAQVAYERFWSGMLCWLLSGSDFMAGAQVALRSDRRLYTDEQPMRLLVRTREIDQETYRPRLSIRAKGKTAATDLEPRPQPGGAFGAEAGPFPPGTYEITLRSNTGRPTEIVQTVEVTSASIENRVLSSDPELMKRLAETSEGQVLAADDVARLEEIVKAWRARRELADEKHALWDHWALLAVLVAALGVEWFLRRREGLL